MSEYCQSSVTDCFASAFQASLSLQALILTIFVSSSAQVVFGISMVTNTLARTGTPLFSEAHLKHSNILIPSALAKSASELTKKGTTETYKMYQKIQTVE